MGTPLLGCAEPAALLVRVVPRQVRLLEFPKPIGLRHEAMVSVASGARARAYGSAGDRVTEGDTKAAGSSRKWLDDSLVLPQLDGARALACLGTEFCERADSLEQDRTA